MNSAFKFFHRTGQCLKNSKGYHYIALPLLYKLLGKTMTIVISLHVVYCLQTLFIGIAEPYANVHFLIYFEKIEIVL